MLHVQLKFGLLMFALGACFAADVQAQAFDGVGPLESRGIAGPVRARVGGGVLANGTVPVCREYQYGTPDLFYNFYAPPNCGGIAAGIYPAPLPVPPHVGHVYYTYQPLMPHEFLYKHHRSYHRYYNEGRGLTRTSVRWW